MARALIVGCGCRGRALGRALGDEGWIVRGTSRSEDGVTAIREAGIEAAIADPQRPGTLLDLIDDVALVFWLLGSANGVPEEIAAIHGSRLRALLERLVDTPVRGFVYEGAGSVAQAELRRGAAAVEEAEAIWRIPVRVVVASPEPLEAWLATMLTAGRELVS